MDDLTVIGHTELIELPAHGIINVPAKTDTGADSSAIWASDIRESKDSITYKLFGPTSKFYTGTDIVVPMSQVGTQVVINSFGHREKRFKVKMTMKVRGRQVRATMTLANRENNRYPVLLGRRLLAHKFVVDVRQQAIDLRKNPLN